MLTGQIVKVERSWGWVVDSSHVRRFFHRSEMAGGLRPRVGWLVEFEVATDARGRPQAVQVRPILGQPPFTAQGARGAGAPLATLGERAPNTTTRDRSGTT
jgi:hypothetical protein